MPTSIRGSGTDGDGGGRRDEARLRKASIRRPAASVRAGWRGARYDARDALARRWNYHGVHPDRGLRSLDLAVRLRHVPGGRAALRPARGAFVRPSAGHERPVDRRPLADHLGYAYGAGGRPRLALLLDHHRRSARALLRILRRKGGPGPRAADGRALRLPVPP